MISTAKQTIPSDEMYLIRKNSFQGVVVMPKEVKKKLILQDSLRESKQNYLKNAMINATKLSM